MANHKGFVKMSRDVLHLPIWHDPHSVTLWLYCILNATHTDYGDLLSGQFSTTYQKLSSTLHWSRSTVLRHLDKLCMEGYLERAACSQGTIITVCHWREISSGGTPANTQDSITEIPPPSHPSTESVPQREFGGTQETYITRIEEKEHSQEDRERDFERFWGAYPRHEERSLALKAYLALDVEPSKLLMALDKAKNSRKWLSANGRYIPSAAKWLDGEWLDYAKDELEEHRKEHQVWEMY